MVALLEREKLLTQAHVSSFEAMMGERELRHLQSMIRQVSTFCYLAQTIIRLFFEQNSHQLGFVATPHTPVLSRQDV